VTLMQTPWDDATVWEVTGPGRQRLASSLHQVGPDPTWTLPPGAVVTQISVAAAAPRAAVQVLTAGRWRTLAAVEGPVGAGARPFLLVQIPGGIEARSVRIEGADSVRDLAVIGRR